MSTFAADPSVGRIFMNKYITLMFIFSQVYGVTSYIVGNDVKMEISGMGNIVRNYTIKVGEYNIPLRRGSNILIENGIVQRGELDKDIDIILPKCKIKFLKQVNGKYITVWLGNGISGEAIIDGELSINGKVIDTINNKIVRLSIGTNKNIRSIELLIPQVFNCYGNRILLGPSKYGEYNSYISFYENGDIYEAHIASNTTIKYYNHILHLRACIGFYSNGNIQYCGVVSSNIINYQGSQIPIGGQLNFYYSGAIQSFECLKSFKIQCEENKLDVAANTHVNLYENGNIQAVFVNPNTLIKNNSNSFAITSAGYYSRGGDMYIDNQKYPVRFYLSGKLKSCALFTNKNFYVGTNRILFYNCDREYRTPGINYEDGENNLFLVSTIYFYETGEIKAGYTNGNCWEISMFSKYGKWIGYGKNYAY